MLHPGGVNRNNFSSSLTWNFRAHAMSIQSRQGDIFSSIAKDSMGIGTQEETY